MIRVLVAEDSAVVRQVIVDILQSAPEFLVVGTARDGEQAVAQAVALRPDVITMDIRMPRLDGLEATRRIMREAPTPIVLVSASVNVRDQQLTFDALRAGALAILEKPVGPLHAHFNERREQLLTTVRLMAGVKVVRRWREPEAPVRPPGLRVRPIAPQVGVIAVGASTGGPMALYHVLQQLPRGLTVPILIVQHIVPGFLDGLVAWLQNVAPAPVKIAVQGDSLRNGGVFLAPDGFHLMVARDRTVVLSHAPPVDGHRPSATMLFQSVAEVYGPSGLGLVLTGMGADGARGLLALKMAGGVTLAQDESSSVVYGMPREAIALGAVDRVLPLDQLPAAIVGFL